MLRLLVTGGLHYNDRDRAYFALDGLWLTYGELFVIEGGAAGADKLAREWRELRKQPGQTFEADWNRYGRWRAGHIRNTQMLTEGKPEHVLAFPGGSGTASMVAKARAAGVAVTEVTCEHVWEIGSDACLRCNASYSELHPDQLTL